MASRIFAILAAMCLVGALALGTSTPRGLTLGQALLTLDPNMLPWLKAHAAPWVWESLEVPLLIRPVWLVPAALGLVFAGAAATFNSALSSSSRRKRS